MREIVLALGCIVVVAGLAGCIGDGGEPLEETQATPNTTNNSSQPAADVDENATNTTDPEHGVNQTDTDTTRTNATETNETVGPIEQWDTYIEALREGEDAEPPRIEDPGRSDEHVVVAVIDSGVNPFHEAFRTDEVGQPGELPVQAVDQATGEAPLYVPIEPVDSMDQTEWLTQALEPRTLYNFAGTNLMFYSVADEIASPDPDGHGTATAGTVARQAPNATIVMVQHGGNFEQAASWAANQTWIDVVSASIGFDFNGAASYACYASVGQVRPECSSYGDLARTSQRAVQSGKLWVNSAGNDPTTQMTDQWDGPPWTIAVGGADPYRVGEAASASKVPDVLSDYIVEDLPATGDTSKTSWWWGTSFAAPTVSGTLADAILELRKQAGYTGTIANGQLVPTLSVTNADVRDAMNRTAIYWGPEDYRPTAPGHPAPTSPSLAGAPVAAGAPWPQMGWGYVNASLSDDIAEVLTGEQDASKSQQARAYMDARQQARQAMWS